MEHEEFEPIYEFLKKEDAEYILAFYQESEAKN